MMKRNISEYITIIGGNNISFDGGQNISIPELTNLLKKKYKVNNIKRNDFNLGLFISPKFRKYILSGFIIFNADFYPFYLILIFLSRLINKKLIFIPRGAYSKYRLRVNFLKYIYILLVHFFFSEVIVFLSKSEKFETSKLILRAPNKKFLTINPTFNYLEDNLVLKRKEIQDLKTIIFAGRAPQIYKNNIRDPKGLLKLLPLFPIFNSWNMKVLILSDLKYLDKNLLKFTNLEVNNHLPYDLFINKLNSANYLFQISNEGEGFSQLIMQALCMRVKLLINKRSLPQELIDIVLENFEVVIPENFFVSEKGDNLSIVVQHFNGNMDLFHKCLFDSAKIYLKSISKISLDSWENLLND